MTVDLMRLNHNKYPLCYSVRKNVLNKMCLLTYSDLF